MGLTQDVTASKNYAFGMEIPDAFVELPGFSSSSDGDWGAALQVLMPGAPGEQHEMAAQNLRALLPVLSREGTVSAALCVGLEGESDDEDEQTLSLGMLTVAVLPASHESALVAAEGIYRAKHQEWFGRAGEVEDVDYGDSLGVQGPQDLLLATRLPCGPAVTAISLRSLTFNRPDGDDGPPVSLGMATLQLIIPAPASYTVYVTISTPTPGHLAAYSERLAYVGSTFTFNDQDGSPPRA